MTDFDIDTEEEHDLYVMVGNRKLHDENYPSCDCMGVRIKEEKPDGTELQS